MKRCMYCGHENEDASETCVKCGNLLMEMPAQEKLPSDQDPVSPAQDSAQQTQDIPDISMPEDIDPHSALYTQNDDAYAQNGNAGEAVPEAYGQGQQVYNGAGTAYPGNEGAPYPDNGYGYNGMPAGGGVMYGAQGQGYGYPDNNGAYYGGGEAYNPNGAYSGYDQNGYREGGYEQDMQGGFDQEDPLLMKKARRRIRNPIGFLGMIFFTIYTVASILNVALGNALTNISTVSHTITKMTGSNVAVNFMNSIVQMINSVNRWYLLGAGLAACIPSVLLMIALWIAFTGTSAKKEHVSTGGYTLARVALIFKFIGVCLVLLAGVVFSVAFVVSAGASSSMMSLIAGVIVLLILILITVFAIMYYVQVLYAVKVIRANVKSGRDLGRIPGYAIFIGFLGCAITVLSMLPMAPDDYIGLITHGSYAVWLLLISFWAIIYKATVKVKRV